MSDYTGPITVLVMDDGSELRVRGTADDIKARIAEQDPSLRAWERYEIDADKHGYHAIP